MRYRRDHEGTSYFFTLVTEGRRPILTLPANVDRLRLAFRREIAAHPFDLAAVVVLPDDLHCLWQLPEGDAEYSGRWARIKRYFSLGCEGVDAAISPSRKLKREKGIWQRRFWEHRIRDDKDWRRHMDYTHFNPVKHGYADSPWEWPFSSLRACAARGWYPDGWGTGTGVAAEGDFGE